jgi:N-acetyl-1-D-myo-inositol-2-amino-2-deoxy-alpha-D-glucopyranoside deacetylase
MKTLLAIFAHPDDESFGIGGTLARYSHAGVTTYYLCGTRGESGTVDPEMLQGFASVAELRSNELECASHELGLAGVKYLGYRDSGMLGAEDNRHVNSLFGASTDEVAQRIITKLHQASVRAYELKYGLHVATEDGRESSIVNPQSSIVDVPRLYVTAMSRKFLKYAVRLLPLFRQDPRKFGRNKDIDLVQISSWFVPITTQINVQPYLPDKERASACHTSQRPPTQQGSFITRLAFRRAQNVETFCRLYPPVRPGERMENDLFGN